MRSLSSPDERRRITPDSTPWRLAALAAVLLVVGVVSIGTGAAPVPMVAVIQALFADTDGATRAIIVDLRLPRALLAMTAGGGLAMTGAVFQALLRNPLAEPYVLGVSGGAAVGAVIAILTGVASVAPWGLPIAAFAGAILAIVLVFTITVRVGRGLDTRVLLLAGVVIGAFFNAVILLLLTFAEAETFRSAVFWMMGSLAGASWAAVGLSAAYVLPLAAGLIAFSRAFNLLALGDDTAQYLGIRVERVKMLAYVAASFIVAAAVAACGVIGFIGLIVPHALRLLWGSDHRLLLPASFLAGGAVLLATDTIARTVAAPAELPVGVITALIGVPLFVVILTRSFR